MLNNLTGRVLQSNAIPYPYSHLVVRHLANRTPTMGKPCGRMDHNHVRVRHPGPTQKHLPRQSLFLRDRTSAPCAAFMLDQCGSDLTTAGIGVARHQRALPVPRPGVCAFSVLERRDRTGRVDIHLI